VTYGHIGIRQGAPVTDADFVSGLNSIQRFAGLTVTGRLLLQSPAD